MQISCWSISRIASYVVKQFAMLLCNSSAIIKYQITYFAVSIRVFQAQSLFYLVSNQEVSNVNLIRKNVKLPAWLQVYTCYHWQSAHLLDWYLSNCNAPLTTHRWYIQPDWLTRRFHNFEWIHFSTLGDHVWAHVRVLKVRNIVAMRVCTHYAACYVNCRIGWGQWTNAVGERYHGNYCMVKLLGFICAIEILVAPGNKTNMEILHPSDERKQQRTSVQHWLLF